MHPPSQDTSTPIRKEALVTCRAGLESVVAGELQQLGVPIQKTGTRAVFFEASLAEIYRINMALHSAINVLVPIRSFNARNYDMLYYQARKTNWHKLFSVENNLRIDVNGSSPALRNTQYVVHRIKDGIVDTFRKLSGGYRPSIDKRDPDIHIVAHLQGNSVILCLDTSGIPLFKRGYREDHGVAPIKEDLAAGILQLAGWDAQSSLLDPVCGSGTFLFEAWMLASHTPPNLNREFAFQNTFDYDPSLHEAERKRLEDQISEPDFDIVGFESDEPTFLTLQSIAREHFPGNRIKIAHRSFSDEPLPESPAFVIANPPYGHRIGTGEEAANLYGELGLFLKSNCRGARAAILSAYPAALKAVSMSRDHNYTLFNGRIEIQLSVFQVHP